MPSIGLKKKKKGEENPGGDAAVQEGEEGQEGGKKSKKKSEGGGPNKLVFVALIVVLVAGALFAGGVVVTRIVLPSMMDDLRQEAAYTAAAGDESEAYPEEESAEEGIEPVVSHDIPKMTVMLAPDQNGNRAYLVIQVSIGFTDKKAGAAFEEKSAEIKDAVLSTLMSKTKDELSTANDIESLKKVLAAKVTKMFASEFKKNEIKIMITEYLFSQ